MSLVAIETREEQGLLQGFLDDNLGSRGTKLHSKILHDPDENDLIWLEKYAHPFWTSGVDENLDGRWNWTSSKRPLLFRNWGSYYHGEKKNRLVISRGKPFTWFNYAIWNENGPTSAYFICESIAPEQEIKHVTAYINAKVKDPDESF